MARTTKLLYLLLPALLFAVSCGTGAETTTENEAQPGDDSAATPVEDDSAEAPDDAEAAGQDGEEEAEDATDGAAETAEDDGSETGEGNPVPVADVTVEVLDAGAEPRQELRIQPPDGTTTMVLEQRQASAQTVDGAPLMDFDVTTITTADITVTAVAEGFEIVTEIIEAVPGPDTDPTVAGPMQTGLDAIVGLTSTARVDNTGQAISADLAGAENLDPSLEQMLSSLSGVTAPLPGEPVGVGARWQLTQPLDLLGVEADQTAIYTLTGIDGTTVSLDVEITQTVAPGSLLDQGGVQLEVIGWDVTGTGSMQWDLTSVVPVSDAVTVGVQQLETAALQGTVQVDTESDVRIRPG